MEVSRLIFTKETKDKMNNSLSKREKGRLRWAKLIELDNDGRLAVAKNRYEVANMVGVINKQVGYSWVSNLIRRKKITETLTGVNQYGQAEYEYHLGSGENGFNKPVVPEKTNESFNINKSGNIKIEIGYKDFSIKLELDDLNQLNLVTSNVLQTLINLRYN